MIHNHDDDDSSSSWRSILLDNADDSSGLWGGVEGYPGSGAIIFVIRHIVLDFLEENGLFDIYDRFVLTRSDHYYGCIHDLSRLDAKHIWVPLGEDHGRGITDRHWIGNGHQLRKALNVLAPIVQNPKRYARQLTKEGFNPEQLLKLRWKEEGIWRDIKRFPRVMFTCAVPGDPTRWSLPNATQSSLPEGVLIKYPYEYEETKCNCQGDCPTTLLSSRRKRVGYNDCVRNTILK
mmetsp:Transcript_28228/g.65358  ORF Transcript_28228/g.65358 Transcript_28228/m.65358 type:complete len:234 (-) Transcript_28228:2172-2873(-)